MQRRLNYTMCLDQRTVFLVALKFWNLSKKVLKVISHIKLKNCERVSNPLLYVLLMFVGLCYCKDSLSLWCKLITQKSFRKRTLDVTFRHPYAFYLVLYLCMLTFSTKQLFLTLFFIIFNVACMLLTSSYSWSMILNRLHLS